MNDFEEELSELILSGIEAGYTMDDILGMVQRTFELANEADSELELFPASPTQH